jgi:hypothetical protein
MGIEPPAGQGIPRVDVLSADPVPEQPVACLHDGPVVAPVIDRPRDRDRPPEQHAGQCGVEVEGRTLPTRDWFLNLQILTSGGFQ